ncbi:MAG: endospore germination permease [Clostridiaceae bacterium]|nr:endospore germination permease [Clostridiaceae bacterium]
MKDKLDSVNMLALIIHSMVGVRLLTLPRDIVQYAENDGWMSVILATILSLMMGFSFYWIGTKHPKLNFSQICEVVLGKFMGKLIMVGIAAYTMLSIALSLRAFGDSLKIFILDTTPLYIIVLVMLLTSVYCLRGGIKTISIVFDLLLPFVILSIVFLILLATTNMESKNLLPVFYGGPKPVFQGFLEIVHPFLGVGVIGYVMPHFYQVKKVKLWILLAILGVGLTYFFIVIMCIMVFGSQELQRLIFPTISLSKTIQLDVEIFERAESLFMTAWIPISFTTIVSYYFSSSLNLKALFNTKRDDLIIYGQLPILFVMALIPQNIVQVYYYLSINNILAQVLSFGLMPLILIATFIKERRKSI